jgi:phytoene dehydrogenase-like protein
MINVPYNNGQDWDQITQQAKTFILKKLTEHLKVDIQNHIVCESVLDPVTIESRTGSNKGSLYGSSSNDRMSAFFRQSNFSNQFDNLYFCGGSVHPGGGIPLCLLSAKIVSKVIFEKN